jgi:hypothetical protein
LALPAAPIPDIASFDMQACIPFLNGEPSRFQRRLAVKSGDKKSPASS